MKILIADEYPSNRKLLRTQLEAEGYAVVEASDGAEALIILEREPVDAVVSDLLMPHMDGFSLCHEIRNRPTLRDLPFISYSATYQGVEEEQLARKLGVDSFLAKPTEGKDIAAQLKELIKRKRPRTSLPKSFPEELTVMKQYSEVLVRKLEKRNEELETARQALTAANEHLEERVRERTAELMEANKELDTFVHSVAHDLSAPLRHIMGYTNMLEEDADGQFDSVQKSHLHAITNSAKRMNQLIERLLNLSRNTRIEMSTQRVSTRELMKEVLAELKSGAKGRIIQWKIGSLPDVIGDPTLLRQVFANLLSNAIKYTRPKPKAVIEVGTINNPGEQTFYIRDNGVGFDMAYVDKLFGVFQRLHSGDEFEGTGIGLANVHRIIARHGGRTWAEGKVGQGATFFFSLPQLKKGEL